MNTKTEVMQVRMESRHKEILKATSERYSVSMLHIIRMLIEKAPMRYEYVDGQRRRVIDFPSILAKLPKTEHDWAGSKETA